MSGPTSRPRSGTPLSALVALIVLTVLGAFSLESPRVHAQDETGDFGSTSPPPATTPAPAAEPAAQPAPAATTTEPAPAETPSAATTTAATTTATTPPAAATTTATPPPGAPMPAPIMVVVLTSGRVAVPEDVQSAVRDAVIAQVSPMTGGRPVLPLMAPALRDAIAACPADPATGPTCIGGQIAGAGAFGAILVRLSKRAARGPVALTLEMVDPVSGSPRLTPLTGSFTDAASAAAALQPLTAQLQGVMFSPPPPPPTLLVTVNVDGARVRVDETELGESPVARTTLAAGRHIVQVTRAGYVSSRRTIELVEGQNERLDVILSPSTAVSDDGGGAGSSYGGGGGGGTPLTEEPLFWVAIGGGVLVVAGIAIGVGVAVANSGPPPNPMGIPLPPIEP